MTISVSLLLQMLFCCLPFRRRGRKTKKNENFFSDDFYHRQREAAAADVPPSTAICQCVRLGRADSACGCDYATPTSAATLMRCRTRQNVGVRATTTDDADERDDDETGNVLPVSLLRRPPSSSAMSYVTAPNGDDSVDDDDDLGDPDFTDDDTFVDAESQGSIDVAEASNIAITDRKEFYATVCDSPLKYQDRFGRSQSMRRYSSAIADRIAVAAAVRSPVSGGDGDDNHELDSEPLELSLNHVDYTQFSETMLEAGPSTTTIMPAAAGDAIDKFGYVEELRERLPEIRDGLRHVVVELVIDPTGESADLAASPSSAGSATGPVAHRSIAATGFPNFTAAEDIGRFLADGQSPPAAGGSSNASLFGTTRARSSVQSKRRHRRDGADDATAAAVRRHRARSEPRDSVRRLAD